MYPTEPRMGLTVIEIQSPLQDKLLFFPSPTAFSPKKKKKEKFFMLTERFSSAITQFSNYAVRLLIPRSLSSQNSIRHNLSLHSRFMRVQNEGTGKSSWWMINKEAKTTGGKSSRRRPSNASSSSSAVDGTEARTATATGGPGKKPRGRSKKQPKVNGINRGASGGGPGGGGPNLNPHLDHVLSSMHPPGVVGGPPINLQSNQAAAMMEMFPGGPPQTQFPFNDLRLSPNGGMVPPPPHAVQSFGSGGPYPQEWSPEGYPPPPPHPPNAAQCGFFPGRNYLDGIPPSSADAADFNPRALSPLSRTGGGSASSPSSFGFNRFDSAASTASPGGASEFHPQFPPQEKNGIPPPSSSPILIHGPHTPYGMQVREPSFLKCFELINLSLLWQTSTSNNRDTSPRPPPQQQQQSVNGRGSHAQFTSQEEPTSLLSPHHHQQQQHNNFFQGSENPSPGPASSRTSNPSGNNNNNNNNNNASGTGAGPTSPLARASSTGSSSVGSMLERALVPKQESQPESPNMHQQSSPSQFPWPQGQPHHHNNPQQQQQQQQQQHNHPSQGNNFSEMDEFLKPEQLDSYMPHHSHQLEQHHHHQHPQHHHHHHHQQGHLHHSQSDRIAAAAAAAGSVQPPQSSPGQQYQQHLTQPPWVR